MPVIKRVNIEDVYPWEDEYGNEFLSRDYSTKENRKYVERLAESMRAKGEPDEPVQLSRDGGIFRIVAGNSRVRAMRLLGTKTFDAVILDDAEAEQAMRRAVEVTVRTNTKKKYDPLEESRFVQQLAMFASDEYVAEAAGIEPEQVRRIRKGRPLAGDSAEDMSLGRLAAISEFEGDEDAIAELMGCKESEYERVADRLRWAARRKEEQKALAEAIAEAGILIFSKPPEGAVFCAYVCSPEGVPETGGPADPTIAVAHGNGNGFHLYRMRSEGEKEEEIEEAERRQERELLKIKDRNHAKEGRARRREWLMDKLANFDDARFPHVCRLAEEWLLDTGETDAVELLRDAGTLASVGSYDVAAYWIENEVGEYGIAEYGYCGSGARGVPEYNAEKFVGMLEAMVADGYQPSDKEREDYEEAKEALGEE